MKKSLEQQWHELSETARDAGIEPPPMPVNPYMAAGQLSALRLRIRSRVENCRPVNILQAAAFALDSEESPYEPARQDDPSRTKPGTSDRVAIYAARAASGKHLFHEEDKEDWS